MRALLCCLMALALATPTRSVARPLEIDDLLGLRELVTTSLDPSGRWLVLEVTPPYDHSPRYEGWAFSRNRRSRLYTVDLAHPGAARPAFPEDARAGYLPGPFSPSGRAMLVFRQRGDRPEMGVLTLQTGQVRWLGLAVGMDDQAETAVWRSDQEVVALVLARDGLAYQDQVQLGAMRRLPALWRAALTGRAATTLLLGSGRYADVHPREPARTAVKLDLRTGRMRTLAHGDIAGFSLSRRGHRLALLWNGSRLAPPPEGRLSPASPWRRHGLSLIDPDRPAAALAPCPDCDVDPASLKWSADEDLLFAAMPTTLSPDGGLWRLSPGASRATLLDTQGVVGRAGALPVADWMGRDPILFGVRDAGGVARADWYRLAATGPIRLTAGLAAPSAALVGLSADRLSLLSGGRLWSVDAEGVLRQDQAMPGLTLLTPTRPHTLVRSAVRDPAKSPAVAAGRVGEDLVAAGLDDGASWSIRRPMGALWPGSAAANGARGDALVRAASRWGMVLAGRDGHGVLRIQVLGPRGPARVVMTLNPQLAAIDWSTPRPIPSAVPGAAPDWLYPPTRRTGAGAPPLVVVGYPGRTFAEAPWLGLPGLLLLDDNPQILAAQGFAVLVPSLPMAPGAETFGTDLSLRIVAAVDRAARAGGFDPSRAAFWGHSAGGYTALRLATETHRFRAIVSAAGPYDLFSSGGQVRPSAWFGASWPSDAYYAQGVLEDGQIHLGTTPWRGPERYARASPLLQADRITTPLLVVAGDQDPVGFSQGAELFAALYRLGKDALFMPAFGETHTLSSPANIRRYWTTAFGFLKAHLEEPSTGAP